MSDALIEDTVATLIELPAAVPTPEPMIALCCQVWPLGHRRRATAYAIHRTLSLRPGRHPRKADPMVPTASTWRKA